MIHGTIHSVVSQIQGDVRCGEYICNTDCIQKNLLKYYLSGKYRFQQNLEYFKHMDLNYFFLEKVILKQKQVISKSVGS